MKCYLQISQITQMERKQGRNIKHWLSSSAVCLRPSASCVLICVICVICGYGSATVPSEMLGGRWIGTVAFRGQPKPIRIYFYGSPGKWSGLVGRPDGPDASVPVINVRYESSRLSFQL